MSDVTNGSKCKEVFYHQRYSILTTHQSMALKPCWPLFSTPLCCCSPVSILISFTDLAQQTIPNLQRFHAENSRHHLCFHKCTIVELVGKVLDSSAEDYGNTEKHNDAICARGNWRGRGGISINPLKPGSNVYEPPEALQCAGWFVPGNSRR